MYNWSVATGGLWTWNSVLNYKYNYLFEVNIVPQRYGSNYTFVDNFKHAQFPVRGVSACTPHKAQGLTLDKVAAAVTAGNNKLYVAASRVRKLEDFVLLQRFTQEDAAKCGPNAKIVKVLQDLRSVETRTLERIRNFRHAAGVLL